MPGNVSAWNTLVPRPIIRCCSRSSGSRRSGWRPRHAPAWPGLPSWRRATEAESARIDKERQAMNPQSEDVLEQLSAAGVSVWLDDISRERLATGNLADLIRDRHVVGVTSNPTIFAHALASGSAYDGQLADLETREVGLEEAARAITTYDIRWGSDVLRPV